MVSRKGASSPAREQDDVVLVLRGLFPHQPHRAHGARRPAWLLWVISHPDDVTADEIQGYDGVFAASAHWSKAAALGARPLLQATNPRRFRPGHAAGHGRPLFVGSTRGEFRPIVRDCLAQGIDVDVHGVGWEAFLPPERITGQFIANTELPAAYASAPVVLNDHWRDMADEGFLSNRLFDAVASGARVLSDEATGLEEVFDGAVRTYASADELPGLLTGDLDATFGDEAQRRASAARIASEHSFEARARTLLEYVREVRR